MARILVLEIDRAFAAALEDRLHVAGHEVELVDGAARAAAVAQEGSTDLLILELALPDLPGIEVVRALRGRAGSRSLPILALSHSSLSAERVAALRAGADDYLAKPCDLEELSIRVERLLGSRGVLAPVLQGDLATHPVWELVQFIHQSTKSGELTVRGKVSSGRLRVRGGQIVSARWKELRGEDALLALLDMKEGNFRLTTEESDDLTPPAGAISIPEVLMHAAWIQDELAKRSAHLPATGVALRLTGRPMPPVDDKLRQLPIAKVVDRLGRQPDVRLYELMTEEREVPSEIRLAVAWLAEHGVLEPTDQALAGPAMTTTEISSTMMFDVAVHKLLDAARQAGFDTGMLPYLLLAEPAVWGELKQLLERAPGFPSGAELRKLVDQLELRQGGSATFPTDKGNLSLHVQILNPQVQPKIEAIAPACAGVMIWLDRGARRDLPGGVVRRLESAQTPAVGVLVAPTEEALAAAVELTEGCRRWQVTRHSPQSLIGVLRLLQPQAPPAR